MRIAYLLDSARLLDKPVTNGPWLNKDAVQASLANVTGGRPPPKDHIFKEQDLFKDSPNGLFHNRSKAAHQFPPISGKSCDPCNDRSLSRKRNIHSQMILVNGLMCRS